MGRQSTRDAQIVAAYPARTMAEIGAEHGVTRQRVQQLLADAGIKGLSHAARQRAPVDGKPEVTGRGQRRWSRVRPVVALSRAYRRGEVDQGPDGVAFRDWRPGKVVKIGVVGNQRKTWGLRWFPRRPRRGTLPREQVESISQAWIDGTLLTGADGDYASSWRPGLRIHASAIASLRHQHGEEMFPARSPGRPRHG
ncbi:MAG: hypothetical protein GY719_26205 [bacterium]|nr:hypothetical protein [bacterium]